MRQKALMGFIKKISKGDRSKCIKSTWTKELPLQCRDVPCVATLGLNNGCKFLYLELEHVKSDSWNTLKENEAFVDTTDMEIAKKAV